MLFFNNLYYISSEVWYKYIFYLIIEFNVIDLCEFKFCYNNGRCIVYKDKLGFICICFEWFNGILCEICKLKIFFII